MKRLFEIADAYIQESNWKTLAGIKFCLFSMGVCVGMFLPKSLFMIFMGIFIITYIPLMYKFLYVMRKTRK